MQIILVSGEMTRQQSVPECSFLSTVQSASMRIALGELSSCKLKRLSPNSTVAKVSRESELKGRSSREYLIIIQMRLLVIRATKQGGRKDYYEYIVSLIRKIILFQNEMTDTELQIIQRDAQQLHAFLYEIQSGFTDKSNMQNFEIIDIFIIVGDHNHHPWNVEARFINILIRMCFRANKHLLACSQGAFESIVFEVSSKLGRNIQIINGPKGNPQVKKHLEDKQLTGKFYLDSVFGQLYSFSSQNSEWNRKATSGIINLHFNKDYFKRMTLPASQPSEARLQDKYSINCKVVEPSSYLVKGVQKFFIATQISCWAVKEQLSFNVIVESNTGPAVIQKDNTVGIHFKIDQNNEDTIRLLQNFMINKLVKCINEKNKIYNAEALLRSDQFLFKDKEFRQNFVNQVDQLANSLNKLTSVKSRKINRKSSPFKFVSQENQSTSVQYPLLTKKDIIKYLHPKLPEACYQERPWAPGQFFEARKGAVRVDSRKKRFYFRCKNSQSELKMRLKQYYSDKKSQFRKESKGEWLFGKFK